MASRLFGDKPLPEAVLTYPLGTNFSEIAAEIQVIHFHMKKMHLKMPSAIFISSIEVYIHTWHVYGVEIYKLINSE